MPWVKIKALKLPIPGKGGESVLGIPIKICASFTRFEDPGYGLKLRCTYWRKLSRENIILLFLW